MRYPPQLKLAGSSGTRQEFRQVTHVKLHKSRKIWLPFCAAGWLVSQELDMKANEFVEVLRKAMPTTHGERSKSIVS